MIEVTVYQRIYEVTVEGGRPVEVTIADTPIYEIEVPVPSNIGPQGPQGVQGIQGDPGPGLPAGGTVGQLVRKASLTDYDTEWFSVDTDDIPEGAVNLYFPEAPIDGNEYVRKDGAWQIATGGGGGAVDSVFGRTGVVVAQTGDYNTDQVTEGGTNLYFTDARVSASADVAANSAHRVLVTGNPHNVLASDLSDLGAEALLRAAGDWYNMGTPGPYTFSIESPHVSGSDLTLMESSLDGHRFLLNLSNWPLSGPMITALATKTPYGHLHTALDITDFDTEVANNSAVAANTAARHTHSNKTELDLITDAGSGVIISSAERTKLSGIEDGAQVNTVDSVNGATGTVVLDSSDLVHRDGETVYDTIEDTTSIGQLDAVVITDTGGLGISWTAGKMRTPAVVSTVSGSGTCTDDAKNYLIWSSGTGLTITTTKPTDAQIEVGCIHCQDGDIWAIHHEETLGKTLSDTHHGISQTLPSLVRDGLVVSEDTDATNPLDVQMSAGTWFRHFHDQIDVSAILSRNTPLVRWFHTGGVWDHDTDAEIDTSFWDNGTNKTAATVNRYYPSLFILGDGVIHWIYPQEQFFTETQALGAQMPEVPPGLEGFPKLTGYVYEGAEATLGTGSRWSDQRVRIAEPANVNAFGGISDSTTALAADGIDTIRFAGTNGLEVAVSTVTGTKQVTYNLNSTATITLGNVSVTGYIATPNLYSFTGLNIQNVINVPFGGAPQMDAIAEKTAAAGVTIDGLLIKDGGIPEAAVTAHEAAIDHDALLNYVAAEHNTDEALEIIIDGGGSTITTGIKGDIVAKCDMTITGWTLLADQSGSIQVDVWKDTYANFPPTVADSIVTPSISSATKNQATGLSISVTKGDVLRFNVDSITTIQRCTVALTGVRV